MFFSKSSRILVLAAHPDDESLGCGGTIALAADAGIPVRVACLGEGVTARFEPKDFGSETVRMATHARERCACRALAVLGVPAEQTFFGVRADCRFDQIPLIELAKEIEGHLRDFNPTHVLVHSDTDLNIDHVLTHRALLVAARPVAESALAGIFTYEVPSSTDWNTERPFQPNVFVNIASVLERKLKALGCYEQEMPLAPHPRSPEKIRALAAYRGAQCGHNYGEAFHLVRYVVTESRR